MRSVRTRRRIAFYSHDTQGLGHIRRNIALAAAVAGADPDTDILLFSGSPEATALPLPSSTEVITLPAICKSSGGSYAARVLDMPLGELIELRGRLIASALAAFMPDLLIVDKVARGFGGELDRTLDWIKRRKIRGRGAGRTRVVLGLRDVLDEPQVTRREWRRENTATVIDQRYDAVWIYGDPKVYHPVAEYRLPARVAEKVTFTGYLGAGRGESDHPAAASNRVGSPPAGRYVLCMVGGGQDGAGLARAFADATFPAGHRGVLVTGPYLPPDARRHLRHAAASRSALTVLEFITDAVDLVTGAAAVVSMGGYNTVCEVLASGRPGLIVPRVSPRAEQAIRADRLAGLGLLDALAPSAVRPGELAAWLAAAVRRPPSRARDVIDLDGLRRIPFLVGDLLAAGSAKRPPAVAGQRRRHPAGRATIRPLKAGRTAAQREARDVAV